MVPALASAQRPCCKLGVPDLPNGRDVLQALLVDRHDDYMETSDENSIPGYVRIN